MTEFETEAIRLLSEISFTLQKMRINGERPAAPKAPSSPASASERDPRSIPGLAHFPNYGRSKNEPIQGATKQDLSYYRAGCERTLADPGKAKFHAKERALLAAIDEELARQGGGAQPSEPPGEWASDGSEPF